ncbi:MAG: hypothetical protein RBR75_03615 [Acholeplasmataceae bacterium]|jgi:hypothetical protein|nr:hypothetical protein [Acholeplasmataceae bacterium]
MGTKGKSNLYGRGKRGKPNENISYEYSKMYLQGGYEKHYIKHGQNEMNLSNDQYRSRGIAFANKVDKENHISFVDAKGLTTKYSLKTKELVMVTKEGNVATYYKTSLKEYERLKNNYENRRKI